MKTVRMIREKKFKGEKTIMDWESIVMKISKIEDRRMIEMNKRNEQNIERLCGVMVRNKEENSNHTSKIMKTSVSTVFTTIFFIPLDKASWICRHNLVSASS